MSITSCPVLTPTKEEFKDFRKYLNTIDTHFEAGIVKVIPPKEYKFTRSDYNDLDVVLPHFYEQLVRRSDEETPAGTYIVDIKMHRGLAANTNTSSSSSSSSSSKHGSSKAGSTYAGYRGNVHGISIKDFKQMAKGSDISNARGVPPDQQHEVWQKREERFWSSVASLSKSGSSSSSSIHYAGDLIMSLFNDAPSPAGSSASGGACVCVCMCVWTCVHTGMLYVMLTPLCPHRITPLHCTALRARRSSRSRGLSVELV